MPEKLKRRTREHVIADMSRVHVESVFVHAGHTATVFQSDYGLDMWVATYDPAGFTDPGQVLIQLKATDTIQEVAGAAELVYDVDIRDYNRWLAEPLPAYLILYDAAARVAYWLYVQRYFEEDATRRPKKHQKHVRVRIPKANVVGAAFVAFVREQKVRVISQARKAIDHAK